MARNKMFRVALNTGKAHIRSTLKDIKTSATDNAEDKYDIELDVLKPNLSKAITDLKDWNKTRQEESQLSRKELKEIALGIIGEAKRVIKDPNSKMDADEDDLDAFFAEMEAELDNFDFAVEDDTSEGNPVEEVASVSIPDNATIAGVAISLLFSVNDNKFRNYLAAHSNDIKAELGVIEYNADSNEEEIREINEMCDNCVHEVVVDGGIDTPPVHSEDIIEEIVEEVENSSATSNLELVMNQPELNQKTGMESDNIIYNNFEKEVIGKLIDLLRSYQRNENFVMVVDRVMICLNKVITKFEATEGEGLGLEILSKYELIRIIRATLDLNVLDSVSLYTMFALYIDETNPATVILNDLTLSIVDTLNKGGGIN